MGFLMNHCVPRQGDVFSWKRRAEDQDWDFQGRLGREAPEKLILGGFGAGVQSNAPQREALSRSPVTTVCPRDGPRGGTCSP